MNENFIMGFGFMGLGSIIGLCLTVIFPFIGFLKLIDEDTLQCKECPIIDNCISYKNFFGGQSKWLFECPFISFLLLKKTCRYKCRVSTLISPILLIATNGMVYLTIYIFLGNSYTTLIYCLCSSMLISLSIIDWKTQYIPIEFNLIILILGGVRLLLNFDNCLEYIIGLFAVSGFLLLIDVVGSKIMHRDGVIGGGDIKLMAAAGLLLGWKLDLLALILGCILGAIIHSIIMRFKKSGHVLAFGPYLSMGIFIAMIWGEQLVGWYLSIAGFEKLAY